MFQSHVPAQFWGECVWTAAYLINRLVYSLLNWETPYYRLYGRNANYYSLRSFGSLYFASTLPYHHSKFHHRVVPSVFVGYPPGMKAYKLYDIENKKFFISCDVVFHESVFPLHQITSSSEVVNQFPDLVLPHPYGQSGCFWEDDCSTDSTRHGNGVVDPLECTILNTTNEEDLVEHGVFHSPVEGEIAIDGRIEASNEGSYVETSALLPTNVNDTQNSCVVDIVPIQPSTFSEVPIIDVRRSSKNIKQPSYLKHYHCNLLVNRSVNTWAKFPLQDFLTYDNLSSNFQTFVLHVSFNTETSNYHEAALNAHWRDAMECELQAMEANRTWYVVPLPKNQHSIGCK